MASLLDELNPGQRQAVVETEGPLLVLAGAGSGKTRVITYRVAYLIESMGVAPEAILALTFTNKAADEMKDRVAVLLAARGLGHAALPLISTFHSFCVRVLRRDIDRLGYGRNFSIYAEDEQVRATKASMKDLNLDEQAHSPRAVLSKISHAKNHGVTPVEVYRGAAKAEEANVAKVFDLYEQKLRRANALDFDDLLLKTVELFDTAPDVRERYNQTFRHLLVDEYQDTNRVQYTLIRQLTQRHQNLCVVGDEDQSIYRWRGAAIENILRFEEDYPAARVVRLEQNYRSTQTILDAAGGVVKHNLARIGKTLRAERGAGRTVGLYQAANAEEEAGFVAAQVSSELASPRAGTIAVLYRTNAQSRILEEALRRARVAYHMAGGFSFYARAEVKDALAYARLVSNLRDSASMARIINSPPRGIGDATLDRLEGLARERKLTLWEALEQELAEPRLAARALKALAAFHELILDLARSRDQGPMEDFFRAILERSELLETLEAEKTQEAQDRAENLNELVNAAREAQGKGESLAGFLDRAALYSDSDDYDERAQVTLMTLHTAKGLEFSTVFLVGLEEGLFPHKLSAADAAEIEEERRLCYVGMTRAKDRLVLTWAAERRPFGREKASWKTQPSRFLEEVPQELTEFLGLPAGVSRPRTSWDNAVNSKEDVERALRERGYPGQPGRSGLSFSGPRPRRRWKLGTQVRHAKYGLGTVLACEGEGDDAKLTVSFAGYGIKKLIERHAALERV